MPLKSRFPPPFRYLVRAFWSAKVRFFFTGASKSNTLPETNAHPVYPGHVGRPG
jgi:hypothetical protein